MATAEIAGAASLHRSFRLPRRSLLVGVGLVVIAALISLGSGAAGLSVLGVVLELADRLPLLELDSGLTRSEATILTQIRLPRMILGGLVGASLAVAGAGYQGVFRNPLADPFLLGIAAGAGLGASIAISARYTFAFGPVGAVQMMAFAGALLAVGAAMLIAQAAPDQTASLILAGVASASFFTAVQTLLLSRSVTAQRSILTFLFGSLIASDWSRVATVAFYLVLCGAAIFLTRRQLDVMRVGETEARALGADPTRIRFVVLIAASLLTAAAVSVSGLIAFVGLVVPHVVRLTAGSSYRIVIPLSAIGGAAFLIGADWISRTIFAPAEVGIGVVTAFIGAPFFAVLLWRSKVSAL